VVYGDTIVVTYDEVTLDNILICLGSPTGMQPDGTASMPGSAFQPSPARTRRPSQASGLCSRGIYRHPLASRAPLS
jgi:hypothetical protein